MVEQVLADPRQIADDRDAVFAQVGDRADPGAEQDRRRAVGTAGQDDLIAREASPVGR